MSAALSDMPVTLAECHALIAQQGTELHSLRERDNWLQEQVNLSSHNSCQTALVQRPRRAGKSGAAPCKWPQAWRATRAQEPCASAFG